MGDLGHLSKYKNAKMQRPSVLSRSEWGRGVTEGNLRHRDNVHYSAADARGDWGLGYLALSGLNPMERSYLKPES